MKTFSIKSIISFANISLYTAITLVFVGVGLNKLGVSFLTTVKLGYIFVILAIIIFLLYLFFRGRELKKTTFQLLPKHKFFMAIFIYGELLLLIISLLYVILANTYVLSSKQVCIFWYVWFPIVFVVSIIISILESIVRVEEKIFIAKQNWIASQKWEAEQKKIKQKKAHNKKEQQEGKNEQRVLTEKSNNPFLSNSNNKKEPKK